jgi:hypothetical protein
VSERHTHLESVLQPADEAVCSHGAQEGPRRQCGVAASVWCGSIKDRGVSVEWQRQCGAAASRTEASVWSGSMRVSRMWESISTNCVPVKCLVQENATAASDVTTVPLANAQNKAAAAQATTQNKAQGETARASMCTTRLCIVCAWRAVPRLKYQTAIPVFASRVSLPATATRAQHSEASGAQ